MKTVKLLKTLSYKELEKEINEFLKGLHERNIEAERIKINMSSSPYATHYLATIIYNEG